MAILYLFGILPQIMMVGLFRRKKLKGITKITIFSLTVIFLLLKFTKGDFNMIDCILLLDGNLEEVTKLKEEVDKSYIGNIRVTNCSENAYSHGYFSYPISQEEMANPLAYTLIVFRNSGQFEQLLRTIYRANNYYCIHVDKKSSSEFLQSVKNMTSCLQNVVVINSHNVRWGKITNLLPELECMKILYENYTDWKYLINLTGEEFPLKSNNEIVRITKALNGSNWIGVTQELPKNRYGKKKPIPPLGLKLYKGPVNGVFCRGFIGYIVGNTASSVLLKWLEDADFPDETFYPTLNFNSRTLDVPGSLAAHIDPLKSDSSERNEIGNRYKQWYPRACYGFYVRSVCILGAKDLQYAIKSKAIFANKFHAEYNPSSLRCLANWIRMKSLNLIPEFPDDYLNFYRNLDFVKNHV